MTNFLKKEWVAAALAQAKIELLGKSSVTVFELQQYSEFLQNEFNSKNLDIVITNELPNSNGFSIKDGIVVIPPYWDLYMLSDEVQQILFDSNLFISFFIELENKKIERLKDSKRKKLSIGIVKTS